jgi:hypothetical protein
MEPHWITEGAWDAETKQYLLLAWLQKVKREFDETRLYPALAALIAQHQHLATLRDSNLAFTAQWKGELKHFDFEKMQLVYANPAEREAFNDTLNALLDFALPRIQSAIDDGKSIYDFVEGHVELMPVGLVPLYLNEGYLLVYSSVAHELLAYRYQRSLLELDDDRVQQLQLELVERRPKSVFETFEQVKLKLIQRFRELPNPATFLIDSKLAFPLNETLLPIARRRLLIELAHLKIS